MRKLLWFLLIPVFIGLGSHAQAQMSRKNIKKNNRSIAHYKGKKRGFDPAKKYNALGISLNAMNYYGDIAPLPRKASTDISFTRPAIGVSFTHRFGPFYQLTGAFTYGTLAGSDAESADPSGDNAYRYVRNLSFRNRVKELSVVGTFDLFANQGTYISRVKWTPYAFLGLAVFHHNPQAKGTDGKWVDLQPLGTEGQFANLPTDAVNYGIKPYNRIQFAIPFGIGARFRINEVMDISGEFGFRYLFTDYIDDVSRNYVDLTLLSEEARKFSYRSNEINPATSESVAAIASKIFTYPDGTIVYAGYGHEYPDNLRGNKNDRDTYTITTIRLTYILGKTFHRAKFR
ncbi:MAG: DUF6089 family protein [Cyclobacteriaceae bacterium]|jgi:hypothetical protein|nr:DUF6089 family protein [Cyclobacteriaceae bacterium]